MMLHVLNPLISIIVYAFVQ